MVQELKCFHEVIWNLEFKVEGANPKTSRRVVPDTLSVSSDNVHEVGAQKLDTPFYFHHLFLSKELSCKLCIDVQGKQLIPLILLCLVESIGFFLLLTNAGYSSSVLGVYSLLLQLCQKFTDGLVQNFCALLLQLLTDNVLIDVLYQKIVISPVI